MARLSHFPTPSCILAVGPIVRRPLPPGALERGLTLALDGIQDPGNVGTGRRGTYEQNRTEDSGESRSNATLCHARTVPTFAARRIGTSVPYDGLRRPP